MFLPVYNLARFKYQPTNQSLKLKYNCQCNFSSSVGKWQNTICRGGFRGGVRGVRPPKIRKAYVMQR